MNEPTCDFLNWLGTLAPQDSWKEMIKQASSGTAVDPETLLRKISPIPDHSDGNQVIAWFARMTDQSRNALLSAEEVEVLQRCNIMAVGLLKQVLGKKDEHRRAMAG
jgi:hypothetical protein